MENLGPKSQQGPMQKINYSLGDEGGVVLLLMPWQDD